MLTITILLTLILAGAFGLGLVMVTDFRGIATRLSARNRVAVEDLVLKGHDAGRFLFFGQSRKVGTFLMALSGFGLLLCVLLLIASLSGDA
ncbi:hypothetical protein [Kitasatospora sp. P5_F3]